MRIATLTMALIFPLLANSAGSAQVITESLFVTVDTVFGGSDSLQQQLLGLSGSGTFSYNSSLLTGSGFESISADQGLTVELTVFGQTFDQTDDPDLVGDFPVLSFDNGNPLNLAFRVSESLFVNNPTPIDLVGIGQFEISSLLTQAGGGFEASLFVLAIPEPTVSIFMCVILILSVRRQVAASI